MHYIIQFLVDIIREFPEIAIFLTLAIGFWFGSLKFRSFSLGAVTSTLLAGLLVGQLHVHVAPVVQATFFLMFLFAVGYSVGPQFFRALKKDGLPQVAFALIVCASGLACAYVLGKMLGYNAGLTAGLLSGGYTNSGTLGVASGYFKQLGLSADKTAAMASLAAIAYAVTYPFGTAGAAWFLGTLGPKLLKVDLAASCKELERTMGVHASDSGVHSAYRTVAVRAYRVENASLIGRKTRDLAGILGMADAFVVRVRQNGGIADSDNGTILQSGATVAIAGNSGVLLAAEKTVGPEVDDA
jgi:putative transport protein